MFGGSFHPPLDVRRRIRMPDVFGFRAVYVCGGVPGISFAICRRNQKIYRGGLMGW